MEDTLQTGRRNGAQLLELGKGASVVAGWARHDVAMEPSFWSWEKLLSGWGWRLRRCGRNGAQLLELGKAFLNPVKAVSR